MPHGSTTPGAEPAVLLQVLFGLQKEIGALQEGNRAMVTAVERLRVETHQRHDRHEAALWRMSRPPPTPSPPGASGTPPGRLARLAVLLQQVVLVLKIALPLGILVAAVAYKGAHPDWLPLLRQLAGLL